MTRRFTRPILALALAALALPAATPALADPQPDHAWSKGEADQRHDRWREDHRDDRHPDYRDTRHEGRDHHEGWRDDDRPPPPRQRYWRHGRWHYGPPVVIRERVLTRDDIIWRGHDGRYYCHRDDGTAGLVIGAVLGGALGNALSDGHDRALGTILGVAGGAAVGNAIDRGSVHCR